MENLNKSQSLWQQWVSLPGFSRQAVIVSLGVAAALFPLPEARAQVRQNGLETESKIEAPDPDLDDKAQVPPGPSDTELNLPPLEQSLITGKRDTTQSSEISPHVTELEEPLRNPGDNKQNPIGAPETLTPFSEKPLAPVAPTPNSSESENLRTWLAPGAPDDPSLDLLTQVPVVPEEGVEPVDSEEAPAGGEIPEGENSLEVELAPDSEEAPPDLEQEESSELEESSEDREYVYGRNGQGRWFVQTGIGIPYNPDESNFYGLAGAGITHFFASGHSINVSLNGLAFNQEGSDSVGINLDVIARWHFIRRPTWSLFVDGGVGFLNTTSRVPLIGGSRFNFTPQVGGGASLRVANKTRLLMGIRWHHISNANLFEPNVGQDAVLGWVGLELPR